MLVCDKRGGKRGSGGWRLFMRCTRADKANTKRYTRVGSRTAIPGACGILTIAHHPSGRLVCRSVSTRQTVQGQSKRRTDRDSRLGIDRVSAVVLASLHSERREDQVDDQACASAQLTTSNDATSFACSRACMHESPGVAKITSPTLPSSSCRALPASPGLLSSSHIVHKQLQQSQPSRSSCIA